MKGVHLTKGEEKERGKGCEFRWKQLKRSVVNKFVRETEKGEPSCVKRTIATGRGGGEQ